ncbi:hypothetical protein Gohar_025491, partial [Gossypium harknessii]|nr:hypothetical protein [Gossypium harknessii]
MEKGFLDKVEDNAAIQIWPETIRKRRVIVLKRGGFGTYLEEYTALLRRSKIQIDKAYSRAANVPTFLKKLMNIMGMSEQWVVARIKQKGDRKCIPWKNLRDLILTHPDVKKMVDVFALSIYRLVIFPKALGHIHKAVSNLFDRLDKRVTPVLAILAKTFRSLNTCRRGGKG